MLEKCLVLDLDDTLVHSFMETCPKSVKRMINYPLCMSLRSRVYDINIPDINEVPGSGNNMRICGVVRPGFEEFMDYCYENFELVAVWSAGQKHYVNRVVEAICTNVGLPDMIWTREECVATPEGFQKPLSKMAKATDGLVKLTNTLIVDDRRVSFAGNPSNGILMPPYDPEPSYQGLVEQDPHLLQLKTWFETSTFYRSTNVQRLNKKRIWGINIDDQEFYD